MAFKTRFNLVLVLDRIKASLELRKFYFTSIEIYIINNPDSSSTAAAEAVQLSTDKLQTVSPAIHKHSRREITSLSPKLKTEGRWRQGLGTS